MKKSNSKNRIVKSIIRPLNTKEKGVMEFLVYKDKSAFVGVCLTFDIIEEGNNPVLLMRSIRESAELHLKTVRKNNMPNDLLNRYAPQEYWEKYFKVTDQIKTQSKKNTNNYPVVSPYTQSRLSTLQFA